MSGKRVTRWRQRRPGWRAADAATSERVRERATPRRARRSPGWRPPPGPRPQAGIWYAPPRRPRALSFSCVSRTLRPSRFFCHSCPSLRKKRTAFLSTSHSVPAARGRAWAGGRAGRRGDVRAQQHDCARAEGSAWQAARRPPVTPPAARARARTRRAVWRDSRHSPPEGAVGAQHVHHLRVLQPPAARARHQLRSARQLLRRADYRLRVQRDGGHRRAAFARARARRQQRQAVA